MISVKEIKIIPLKEEFFGRGEVKGYFFRQISATNWGFIYEVSFGKGKHYEVFKRRENSRFCKISYPGSESFGNWAWTYPNKQQAKEKLFSFSE